MWRIPLWAAYGCQLQWIKTKNLKFKPFAGEKGCVISNSWDCGGCLCQSCCLKVASCWAPSVDTWFTWRKFRFLPIVSRSLNCNVTSNYSDLWHQKHSICVHAMYLHQHVNDSMAITAGSLDVTDWLIHWLWCGHVDKWLLGCAAWPSIKMMASAVSNDSAIGYATGFHLSNAKDIAVVGMPSLTLPIWWKL